MILWIKNGFGSNKRNIVQELSPQQHPIVVKQSDFHNTKTENLSQKFLTHHCLPIPFSPYMHGFFSLECSIFNLPYKKNGQKR